MPYDYQTERPKLFTEGGQLLLLKMRDTIARKLKVAGAVTAGESMEGCTGDSWQMLAVLDRLVELREIRRIEQRHYVMAQDEIYVSTKPG